MAHELQSHTGSDLAKLCRAVQYRTGYVFGLRDEQLENVGAVTHPQPIKTAAQREAVARDRALRWAVHAFNSHVLDALAKSLAPGAANHCGGRFVTIRLALNESPVKDILTKVRQNRPPLAPREKLGDHELAAALMWGFLEAPRGLLDDRVHQGRHPDPALRQSCLSILGRSGWVAPPEGLLDHLARVSQPGLPPVGSASGVFNVERVLPCALALQLCGSDLHSPNKRLSQQDQRLRDAAVAVLWRVAAAASEDAELQGQVARLLKGIQAQSYVRSDRARTAHPTQTSARPWNLKSNESSVRPTTQRASGHESGGGGWARRMLAAFRGVVGRRERSRHQSALWNQTDTDWMPLSAGK